MAFSDWTIYTESTFGAFLNFSDPILGGASLSMVSTDGSNNDNKAINMHLGSEFPRGFSKGRIRMLARINRNITGVLDDNGPGVWFMSNSLNISNTPSNYYWAGLEISSDMDLVIAKASSKKLSDLNWSTSAGVGDVLAKESGISVIETDIIPFQVEWESDLVNIGGTRIIFSLGAINDTGFASLEEVLDYVDGVSPYTTSVGEGIGYGATLEAFTQPEGDGFTIDQTGIFRLV